MANNPYTLTPTAAAIYKAWKRRGDSERPRTYLGASIIGHACDMYLWLYFRGVVRESFDGRMYRLFDRGKREEAVFVEDLRAIGCEVREFDENGQQFAVTDFGGHFGGHLDGVCRGLAEAPKKWHVVEFKTHSDASFRKLCKEGVAKAKPMHYDQMTVYMGSTGIEDALYVAVNKDNDELYTERIAYDKAHYDFVMARARNIIETVEPQMCASRPDDFRCKACPCHGVCWNNDTIIDPAVPFSCRTCCHATADIHDDGAKWTCDLGHSCSTEREACEDYLILPALVRGEIVDGSADAIRYTASGNEFTIRKGTKELKMYTEVSADKLKPLDDVKKELPKAKVIESNRLEMKYSPTNGYYSAFEGPVDKMKEWMSSNPTFEDWANPKLTDEFDGKRYFEYANSLVIISADGKTGRLITSEPPF